MSVLRSNLGYKVNLNRVINYLIESVIEYFGGVYEEIKCKKINWRIGNLALKITRSANLQDE